MHETLEMHKLQGYEHTTEHYADKVNCKGMELAEAYVRDQPLDCMYPPEEGLMMGTAFPNLSKPYKGWCKRPAC